MALQNEVFKHPILLVDDNASDRDLFRYLLTSHLDQVSVIEASGCGEALILLKQHTFSCCIVDYQLPGQDGKDFLKAVRNNESYIDLPIVILTGEGCESLAVDMLKGGAQDYLIKDGITAERLVYSLVNAINTVELQKKITLLAHHDSLTGLLNRSLFLDRLQNAIEQSNRYTQSCALLFLDVDNFKPVNDRFGHAAGDAVLVEIALRLKQASRASDSVCRLGGDEFAVLIEQVDHSNANLTAAKLLSSVTRPMTFKGQTIEISASIGIAYYPETATDAMQLMQQADEAMYMVKKGGKNNFLFFNDQQKEAWRQRLALEQALPGALLNDSLHLVYLPIVSQADASLHSLEVLVRWRFGDYDVSPEDITDMVDRLGLFDTFHKWLIDRALKQLHCWRDACSVKLALNMPLKHAHSELIAETLQTAMAQYDIEPERIQFDIAEESLQGHPNLGHNLLSTVNELGVSIAIDDFGSSLTCMKDLVKLPINVLKIDQQFFMSIAESEAEVITVRTITSLGHSLGFKVLAEGVSSEQAYRIAREVNCDYIQGHYLGKPQPANNDWSAFLAQFPQINRL